MSDLMWFKSSYSGSNGGDCVEVAYDWRKSTHSGSSGGECVEVAIHPTTVHIRDSKDPQGPALAVPAASWAAFVAFAAAQPS
ncbi:DUF397 domain-containing protein [Streptomyces sp. DSM 41987]|uniref:DUF397 domain-containing protein n=1 Tax=Streptomyces TaxID=1883 RepID=UPI0018DFAF4C|nr:DUF397 domain-containing protein [Streptomyces fildesensis]